MRKIWAPFPFFKNFENLTLAPPPSFFKKREMEGVGGVPTMYLIKF